MIMMMIKKTTVVNLNKDKYDVYIGRGSIWGCPFIIGVHGTRKQCIEQYKYYIIELINTGKVDISELEGKVLGCYCKPKACHGDFLCEITNRNIFQL